MTNLSFLQPTAKNRIYDLVRDAGVDVRDWAKIDGGKARAASNPKYCYEWAYVQRGKVVVLNLWFDSIQLRDGEIVYPIRARRFSSEQKKLGRSVVSARAKRTDDAVRVAFEEGLPVRAVICDGRRRNAKDRDARPSQVYTRLLDPEPWAVTEYDGRSGDATIMRGAPGRQFTDQFDVTARNAKAEKREVRGEAFVRNPEVRRRVLARARGDCEWCGVRGFKMADGRIYLETHHVIPLAEGGDDSEANVVALCPNHHREAHHGIDSVKIRRKLLARLRQ